MFFLYGPFNPTFISKLRLYGGKNLKREGGRGRERPKDSIGGQRSKRAKKNKKKNKKQKQKSALPETADEWKRGRSAKVKRLSS